MIFLNSVSGGNDVYALPENQRRRESGTFPSVRVTAELQVNQYVEENF